MGGCGRETCKVCNPDAPKEEKWFPEIEPVHSRPPVNRYWLKDQTDKIEATSQFDTGAVRSGDLVNFRFDCISPIALRRLAARYRVGIRKGYSVDNWAKGFPQSDLVNHIYDHWVRYISGDRSEDNLAAIGWGIFTLMHLEETMPEMMDMDRRRLRVYEDDGVTLIDRSKPEPPSGNQ